VVWFISRSSKSEKAVQPIGNPDNLSYQDFRIGIAVITISWDGIDFSSSMKPKRARAASSAFIGPDPCRIVEQTVFLLLLGQPGELGVERMIDRQKRLFAVEDRWIGTDGVFLPSLYPEARSFVWNNSRGAVARL
jgi:hypothetical protein